jgi:hypothetical protein
MPPNLVWALPQHSGGKARSLMSNPSRPPSFTHIPSGARIVRICVSRGPVAAHVPSPGGRTTRSLVFAGDPRQTRRARTSNMCFILPRATSFTEASDASGEARKTSTACRERYELPMKPRYLFVVSRQHWELYDLLVERFRGDDKVEVVVDRRAATHERVGAHRETDRRQRRSPEDDLTRRSHLIITRTD